MNNSPSILALDVGSKRIGVAIATRQARIPRPLTTITVGGEVLAEISRLIEEENVDSIVVGYPRNLAGNSTAQTNATEDFIDKLKTVVSIPIITQDEALTSLKAEAELKKRARPYNKGDVDALAAVYILEDFLASEQGKDL